MTEQSTNSLNTALITELHKLEEKRNALIESNITPVEGQTVMIPIPNVLVKDEDEEVCNFIKNVGRINREKSLGLKADIEAGETVILTDGRESTILETVFTYTAETDINAVEAFLNANS